MKSMLTIALYRPEAFAFVSLSPELSRIHSTSTIASKLVQTAFTASAWAVPILSLIGFEAVRHFQSG